MENLLEKGEGTHTKFLGLKYLISEFFLSETFKTKKIFAHFKNCMLNVLRLIDLSKDVMIKASFLDITKQQHE